MDIFLKKHLNLHPIAQAQDAVKFLYQRCFAGGHMVSDSDICIKKVSDEMAHIADSCQQSELLGGGLGRLSLSDAVQFGIKAQTAARMFIITANNHTPNPTAFQTALDSSLPIPDWRSFVAEYRNMGCPSLHHSDAYRAAYHPAYRVVQSEFIALAPLVGAIDSALDKQDSLTIAIDGPCGNGKSTLSAALSVLYDANLFHTDDFFPQAHQRTDGRLNTPGGNLDHERLLEQVLIPLRNHLPICAQKFSCSQMSLSAPATYPQRRVNIIEGSYSSHPLFREYIDITAFVSIDAAVQRTRLLHRGSDYSVFQQRWIPLENEYFDFYCVRNHADVIIDNEEDNT